MMIPFSLLVLSLDQYISLLFYLCNDVTLFVSAFTHLLLPLLLKFHFEGIDHFSA